MFDRAAYDKALHADLWATRRAAGLCAFCGVNPLSNKWRCVDCQRRHSISTRRYVQARLDAGLCAACGKHPLVNKRRCAGCQKKHGHSTASRRKQARMRKSPYQTRVEAMHRDPYATDYVRWKPKTPPKATHIAGYVPPPGSVARMFLGRVVSYA